MEQSAEESPSLSLREAMADFGWLPSLFVTVVGAPSILALLPMVREGFRLSAPFQWIIDGYNLLANEMAAWIEPLIRPVIGWISSLFGWQLVLFPHWRPLFLLQMVLVMALGRSFWRRVDDVDEIIDAVIGLGLLTISALVGASVAGLVPLFGDWKAQGVMAAVPVALFMFALLFNSQADESSSEVAFVSIVCGLAAFFLASVLSIFVNKAGLWVLAALVVRLGQGALRQGLKKSDVEGARIGLTMLGGFAIAGGILMADAMVKALI